MNLALSLQGHMTSSVTHVSIRFPLGHFLLVVLWNQASISNDFRGIQRRMWPGGAAAAAPPPLRPGEPALWEPSRPLVIPY